MMDARARAALECVVGWAKAESGVNPGAGLCWGKVEMTYGEIATALQALLDEKGGEPGTMGSETGHLATEMVAPLCQSATEVPAAGVLRPAPPDSAARSIAEDIASAARGLGHVAARLQALLDEKGGAQKAEGSEECTGIATDASPEASVPAGAPPDSPAKIAAEMRERAEELLRNRWDYVTDYALNQWAARIEALGLEPGERERVTAAISALLLAHAGAYSNNPLDDSEYRTVIKHYLGLRAAVEKVRDDIRECIAATSPAEHSPAWVAHSILAEYADALDAALRGQP